MLQELLLLRANYGLGKSNGLRDDILPFLEESVNQFNHSKKDYSKARALVEQVAWKFRDQAVPPQFTKPYDRSLGRGTYSTVNKVQEVSTGQLYALKRIPAGAGSSQVSSFDRVMNEINIMRKLSHHHITTLGYSTKDNQGFNLHIFPVAECDLGEFLRGQHHLFDYLKPTTRHERSEKMIYKRFGCLISALDYAHRSDIKHRDLKPSNILIDEKGERILLTDFGLAKDFSDHGVSRSTGPLIIGTSKYLAPECTPEGE